MTRLLDFVIFFALILCALAVVESQYVWRETYNDLYQAEKMAKQYDVEYAKLELEQSTQAKHSRVEAFATSTLQMQVPDDLRVQVVEVQ
jgi:cell division protein FtsL